MEKTIITIGSIFSGIGGFELGFLQAIPNSKVIFQVEIDSFCRKILKKNFVGVELHKNVFHVGKHNLKTPNILLAGFPCQDISNAGKMEGIHGKKSGLWFELLRVISELRPPIIVLENVPNITFYGIDEVLGGLAQNGYDAEWKIISASEFGAPHLRRRWFCVAYSTQNKTGPDIEIQTRRNTFTKSNFGQFTYSSCIRRKTRISKKAPREKGDTEKFNHNYNRSKWRAGRNYWKEIKPPVCLVDDGIPFRVAKLKALGNSIVPQCSNYIALMILYSGLLQQFENLEDEN